MKERFEIPNRDSAGFVKYRDFYSLIVSKGTGIQKEDFFELLEAIENLESVYKFRAFDNLVDLIINLDLLDKYLIHLKSKFLSFLDVADKQPKNSYAFYYLFQIAKNTGLIREHIPFFVESIEDIVCPMKYYDVGLTDLAEAAIEAGVIKKYLPIFLKVVDKLTDHRKIRAFHNLIEPAIDTGLLNKNFLALLEKIDQLPEDNKSEATTHLIESIDNKLLNEHRPLIENTLVSLMNRIERVNHRFRYRAYGSLLISFKLVGIIEEHFSVFLENVDKLKSDHKYLAVYDLIKTIKNTELFDKYYLTIKNRFFYFLDDVEKFVNIEKYDAFRALIKLEEGTGLIVEDTPIYLELIKKMTPYRPVGGYAYSKLLKALKKSGMKQDHFPIFLEILDTNVISSKYEAFCALLEAANANDLVKDNFISLLERINQFKYIYKYDALHEFIKIIKHTDSMINYKTDIKSIFQSLLKDFETLRDYERYDGFIRLLEIAKEIGMIKKFFDEILGIFPELPEIDSLDGCIREEIYDTFVEAIESFDLENERVFINWNDKNQHYNPNECY